VDLVDLLIILIVIAASLHGLLLGAATQALSFSGVAVGLVLGAALAPAAARLGRDPTTVAAFALLSLFVFTSLFGTVGRQIGVRLWGRLRQAGLAAVDSVGGAVLAIVASLTACWLIGNVLATAPARGLASEVQRSAILRALNRLLPPAPSIFSRLQRLIDAPGFPQVFAELEPNPAGGLPLPAAPVVRAAVALDGASTVKIVGGACGYILEGSGFVAAAGLVITNAHVVAGVRHPMVLDQHGLRNATPVLFNPNLDVAVLRVTPLDEPPLKLLDTTVSRGTGGAVLGYPGGGPFDAEAAVVLTRRDAIGRNIYGQGLTTRAVYEIESRVRPGNSGGPLVEPNGTVIGVVFARSSLNDNVGYALTSNEVLPELTDAASAAGPVSTGPCAAG
jgi:S1-C subfamily serine protease